MKKQTVFVKISFFWVILLAGILLSGQTFASTMYQITIENLSPNVLSPVAFVTHNMGFDLFDEGSVASSAVELLAETGNPAGVISLASVSGSVLDYGVASGGILALGSSGSIILEADLANPWLSFMSMMGISNDGFIGGTTGDFALSLFSGGLPLSGTYIINPEDVWDAGTEVNDEALGSVGALGGGNGGTDEGGVVFLPHPGILGIADVNSAVDWTGGPVARITVSAIPEPSTAILFIAGLIGISGAGRKQGK